MKHGEAWYLREQSVEMIKGEFVPTLDISIPPPMDREEAGRYYNTKLFAYWMTQLDDRLSIHRKAQIISALMFGHVEKYKHFKELNHEDT